MTSGPTPGERQRQYLDRMERARRIQEMEEKGLLDPPSLSQREKRIVRGLTVKAIVTTLLAAAVLAYFLWGGS